MMGALRAIMLINEGDIRGESENSTFSTSLVDHSGPLRAWGVVGA